MVSDPTAGRQEPRRPLRFALVFLGLALSQFVLYGPSLIGLRILLPLELLAGPGFYIPESPAIAGLPPGDGSFADMVLSFEPTRRFAASEFSAGRWPTWGPYHYAGAPLVWPKFSPFLVMQGCVQSPVILAWSQFMVAMVAGFGAYVFLRLSLTISFWPAAICAWAYPLTGFFVIWQGFFTVLPVCWLPWLLLTVDKTVHGNSRFAPLGLAVVTCLVVVSGQLDVAGQVLLASGLYALWRVVEGALGQANQQSDDAASEPMTKSPLRPMLQVDGPACRLACGSLARLGAGWTFGLLLAAPYFLPVLEYTHTGARMVRRNAGAEERPPVGLEALPQLVLPDMYGITRQPGLRYAGGFPQQESSAAGYTGLILTLLVAPLAFLNRRRLASNVLWMLLFTFALSWCLNIPGLVGLLRLPGLNMMSHNRLVFLACIALLALASTGFENLLHEPIRWRSWMWLPLALFAGLCVWCAYRSVWLPEPIATRIPQDVLRGKTVAWIHGAEGVRRLHAWFVQYYASAAVWCGLGVLGWVWLRSGRLQPAKLVPLFGALAMAELLWFGYGRNVQCDPALYYPPIPVLQSLAKAAPGRAMGFGCLPATLSALCGFRDVRGDDGVDPARLVELVLSAADPTSMKPRYAPTMEIAPKATITPEGDIQLPPVLDMLGVRYVIFQGNPFPKARPLFQSVDYWVLKNPRALDRAFVPERVEVITNDALRVQKLESPDFKPSEVAYVETPVDLAAPCRGTVQIVDEIPTRVNIQARMETPGLIVLSDLWDKGWHAYLDGKPASIPRTNHAVRGVVVSTGSHTLQFKYAPASFMWGLRLAGFSAVILLGWLGISLWRANKSRLAQPGLAYSPQQPAQGSSG